MGFLGSWTFQATQAPDSGSQNLQLPTANGQRESWRPQVTAIQWLSSIHTAKVFIYSSTFKTVIKENYFHSK